MPQCEGVTIIDMENPITDAWELPQACGDCLECCSRICILGCAVEICHQLGFCRPYGWSDLVELKCYIVICFAMSFSNL